MQTDLADDFVLSSAQPGVTAKKIGPELLEINLPKDGEELLRRDASV